MKNLLVRIKAHPIAQFVQRHALALAIMAALVVALAPASVAGATSFSIDTSSLLSSAADIFNGLWPAFAIVAGLGLGIALVKFIVGAIRGAFGT